MSINMRRGLLADFDPGKMTAGEWAVSIDPESENQIVWMCFAPGVVKRMGTYEDFQAQIRDATGDIREEYVAVFDEIKSEIEGMKDTVTSDKDTVLQVKDDVITDYLPQMLEYVNSAEASKAEAEKSAQNAAQSETDADKWAKLSKSYARGDSGAREDEATDNGLYYLEQTRSAANSITGALKPKGNITFEQLADLEPAMGDYYNVTDAFTSDSRFADGAGIDYPAGTDIYYTDEGKWNAVQGAGVAGVKGHNESAYRKGLVDITPDNIGLGNVDNTHDSQKTVAQANKVTHPLNFTGGQSYDGSANVNIDKSAVGLGKVENLSSTEILGSMTKEQVTTALGYTPAGGENLVLDSATEVRNSDYKIAEYILSESLQTGKTYTATIWGTLGSESKLFALFMGGGVNSCGGFSLKEEGVYQLIFATPDTIGGDGRKDRIQIYTVPSNVIVDSYISKIKLERGTVTNPVWTPAPEDVVTKTPADIFDALDSIPEMHRNIFRGKNLGDALTAEQKAQIKAGTFDDIWVGDYWVIKEHTWRIVDIDYWMNKGDTSCTTHHVVVMPDSTLYTHNMNAANDTTGAYVNSLMYTEGLEQAKTIVNTDFGAANVLSHRILLANATASGHQSAGQWYTSTVELANEIMMYGSHIFAALGDGTFVPYVYTVETTQLALFRLVPKFINANRQWFWLRDVVSGAYFADVSAAGAANNGSASGVGGVRPVVGITGGN